MCLLFILEMGEIWKVKVCVVTFLKDMKMCNHVLICDGMFIIVGVWRR